MKYKIMMAAGVALVLMSIAFLEDFLPAPADFSKEFFDVGLLIGYVTLLYSAHKLTESKRSRGRSG